MSTEMQEFRERACLIWNLYTTRSLLNWDHQVNMPHGGGRARAQQLSTIERVAHDLLTQDSFVELLKRAEDHVSKLPESDVDRCFVEAVRRKYDLGAKLPAKLVEEFAKTVSVALEAWQQAKKENFFSLFSPHLEKVFKLAREICEHRGYTDHPYDAMLGEWEAGMLTSDVENLFRTLQPPLSQMVAAIARAPQVNQKILNQQFDVEKQRQFAKYILENIGFDFSRGRLDQSSHPFCSSYSYGDVRLTDRFDPDSVQMSIFGALHEGGHGLYEQGSPPELDEGPLRGGASLGVHESQSRLWENFVGRSLPFWKAHFPVLRRHFPHQLSGYSAHDFFLAVNAVQPSFIRVEADEVTYTLHIILRFELEKAMLDGSLTPSDLPQAWNEKMEKYLGITPPSDAVGCLQDVHWSDGLIGYFPTYSLGNVLGAQMWRKIRKAEPDLDHQLEKGDSSRVLGWLRQHLHVHGSRYTPKRTIEKCLGEGLDPDPFLKYLEEKYSTIYGPITVSC